MIALRIEIDGETYITAGVEDWVQLMASVTLSRGRSGTPVPHDGLEVSLGGHSRPDSDGTWHQLRWPEKELPLRSVITISVVEVDEAEGPPLVRRLQRHESDG
jgi:hypothetical protein